MLVNVCGNFGKCMYQLSVDVGKCMAMLVSVCINCQERLVNVCGSFGKYMYQLSVDVGKCMWQCW